MDEVIRFVVPGEIWKPVNGFEDEYEVSNLGRVRSLDRIQHRSNGFVDCDFHIKGQLLKPYITGKNEGYYTVAMKGKNIKVHRIVAEAFLPMIEGKNEVNHIDGNKHNNVVSNLEWVTALENSRHALITGLKRSGERALNSKLSDSDVLEIRREYRKGDSKFGAKPLARLYGVSSTSIRDIVNNRKWRFVNGIY